MADGLCRQKAVPLRSDEILASFKQKPACVPRGDVRVPDPTCSGILGGLLIHWLSHRLVWQLQKCLWTVAVFR